MPSYFDKIRLFQISGNRLFLPVAAGYALGYQPLIALPFMVGVMEDAFGFSSRQIGIIAGLEIFAMALTLLLVAPRVSRFLRHYTAFAGGLAIATLQLVSLVAAQDFLVFCALRMLLGVTSGVVVAMANSCIAMMPQPERHCGYAFGLSTFSYFCLYVMLGAAIDADAAVGAYTTMAALAFLLSPFMLVLPPHTPKRNLSGQKILRSGLLLLLIIPLYYMGQIAVLGYAERIGMGAGLSDISVGVALGLGEFVSIGAPLLAAAIGVRYGHVLPIAISSAAMVGMGLILLNTMSPFVFFVAYCGFLFLDLFKDPYLMGLAARLDPQGRVLAAATGSGLMGSSLGINLAGNLIQTQMDFAALSWLLLLPCLLALYLLRPVARVIQRTATGGKAAKSRGRARTAPSSRVQTVKAAASK